MEVIKGVPFFLAVTHDAGLRHLEKGSSTWCADVVINWSFISGVLKKKSKCTSQILSTACLIYVENRKYDVNVSLKTGIYINNLNKIFYLSYILYTCILYR